MNQFSVDQIGQMVDYKDLSASLQDRGRAYLAMNCAHCHNPSGWEGATDREFDFRYETPLNNAGIRYEKEKIKRAIEDQEMPLIGTKMLDNEGIELLIEFLDNL